MLPKIDVVQYSLELPLSKKKIKFRPFLVKEEKILLMAMESDDDSSMLDAIKQVVNNCCEGDFDVETIPTTDLDYIFLNLRARSVGEVVDLEYKCSNEVSEGHKCGNIVKFSVNLLEINAEGTKPDNRIQLTDTIGVVMKYPSLKAYEVSEEIGNNVDKIMTVILNSIDCVYDEDNVYPAKDSTKEELQEFIESLNKEQFSKIEQFFENIPSVQTTLKFHCNKCGHKQDILVKGAQSFFV